MAGKLSRSWERAYLHRERDKDQYTLKRDVDAAKSNTAVSSSGRYQVKLSSIGGKKKEQVEKLVRTYNRVDRLGDNSKQQWCAPFIEVTTEVPGTASMKNPERAERALSMRVILERVKKPVLSVV